jgi:hypothetical protein
MQQGGTACASSRPHPALSCYYGAFDEAFETRRHLMAAAGYRCARAKTFRMW